MGEKTSVSNRTMEVRCNRNFVEKKTLLCSLCFFSLKEQVAIYRQNTRVLEFDTSPWPTRKGGRKDGHVTTTVSIDNVVQMSNAIQMNSGNVKNTARDFHDIRLH